jgi:hypothetical protein
MAKKRTHQKSASRRGSFELRYYAVAVLDLLGQKQAIRELGKIELIEENRSTLVEKLKESFGARDLFKKAVLPLADKLIHHPPAPGFSNLSPNQKGLYRRLRASRLRIWSFSDTVVAYAPLGSPQGDPAVRDLYSILVTCATTMLLLLGEGIPVRGAVEIGTGLETRDGEIYGPAFVDAYDLHENIAGYPRIVVGDRLRAALHNMLEYRGNNDVAFLIREIARLCASLVTEDQDGMLFVDYLGPGFRQIIDGGHYYQVFQTALEFVKNEHESRIKLRDCKLAARYAWLRQYFEARAPGWNATDEKT